MLKDRGTAVLYKNLRPFNRASIIRFADHDKEGDNDLVQTTVKSSLESVTYQLTILSVILVSSCRNFDHKFKVSIDA